MRRLITSIAVFKCGNILCSKIKSWSLLCCKGSLQLLLRHLMAWSTSEADNVGGIILFVSSLIRPVPCFTSCQKNPGHVSSENLKHDKTQGRPLIYLRGIWVQKLKAWTTATVNNFTGRISTELTSVAHGILEKSLGLLVKGGWQTQNKRPLAQRHCWRRAGRKLKTLWQI